MTKEELEARIAEINNQIDTLASARSAIRAQKEIEVAEISAKIAILVKQEDAAKQQLAELLSPLKIGDNVVYERGDIWQIKQIVPIYSGKYKGFYDYLGAKVNSDGTVEDQLIKLYFPKRLAKGTPKKE